MKLVRLVDAGQSGTPLGKFLEALMRNFKPAQFVKLISKLERNYAYLVKNPDSLQTRLDWEKKHLLSLEALADKYGLEHVAYDAQNCIGLLRPRHKMRGTPNLLDIADRMRDSLANELDGMSYLEIDWADKELFHPKAPLFGPLVHKNFRSSRYDIREAGKCLALDRGTAAVVHLMRALEAPLIAMAKEVGFTPKKNAWGGIIPGIQDRLNPRNPLWINDHSKRIRFSAAAARFNFFKDAWRDNAAHQLEKYTPEEARSIFDSVKAFMIALSKKGLKG